MPQKSQKNNSQFSAPLRVIVLVLSVVLILLLIAAFCIGFRHNEMHFSVKEINLVSSVDGYTTHTDSKLTDAWGLEFGHTGRIWLNTSSGYSTVYDGAGNSIMVDDASGAKVPLAVQIPTPPQITDEPAPLTGMVFSETNAFSGDSFVFVTEQGTIAGWDKPMGNEAVMRVDNSEKGVVYKGVTAAKSENGWQLYAANFGKGTVNVYNTKYESVTVSGGFRDETLPKSYAPFNIKLISGKIYVTYAKQGIDKSNDVAGVGNGYIDIFDVDGNFQKRLVSNGQLNSPWGIALAPNDFGSLSNMLLVGNFGDGEIHAYDPENGEYKGIFTDEAGNKLQIDKLWSLTFGTDNGAGKHNQLFFAAGPSAEDQGLFGRLDLLPIQ